MIAQTLRLFFHLADKNFHAGFWAGLEVQTDAEIVGMRVATRADTVLATSNDNLPLPPRSVLHSQHPSPGALQCRIGRTL